MPIYFNGTKYGGLAVKVNSATGGTDTSDATMTSGAQMLAPYTAYSKGVKYTGGIPSKAAATITPGSSDQEIAAGQYLAGKQTIKGDANLLPENIKSGVSIFGVSGTVVEDTTKEVTQATPTITVGTDGLITASATQAAGKVEAGTKSTTKQLPVQAAKTVTPGALEQTAVEPGAYTTGAVKVAPVPTETKSITENGTYEPNSGKFFSSVTVNVPSSGGEVSLQEKTVIPSESEQTVTPDSGYDGLYSVKVGAVSKTYVGSDVPKQPGKTITPGSNEQTAVDSGVYTTGAVKVDPVPTETKEITGNGTYSPSSGKFFSSVSVNVPFDTQAKTVTPSETEQTVTPDSGYDGLSGVTVNAIPSTYVGSGVPKQGAKTVTPSTSQQTAVSGGTYVTDDITVDAMPTGALGTPSVDASGLVTAEVVTGGYIPNGTKKTLQLTTQATKKVTPSTSEQTAVNAGVFTTGAVKVAAMPSGDLGTPSVDANGLVTAQVETSGYIASGTNKTLQLTTQGAQTITPGTSDKTIASGRYLTGTQTIKGDSNLVAGNIKSGVSIFGVSGSYEGEGGSGGAPSTIVAGDTPVASSSTLAATINSTSMTATGISITIKKAGTYRFKFGAGRTSTSGTWTTQLYKNGSAISGATATWSSYQGTCTKDVSCAAGDVIQIYGRSRSTYYRLIVGQLVACIDWDTGL